MQYIPTDLPQYWKLRQRSDFSDAVIQDGHVLLFSQDGHSIIAKLSDGSYVVQGGSNSASFDFSLTTLQQSDALAGKNFYNKNGVLVSGTIPSKGAQTYTPGTSNQVITKGQYLSDSQVILGDANLIADNIASGVSIFGVQGTHQGGSSVRAGVLVSDRGTLKVQPLRFDGTVPSDSGALEVYDLGIFETGHQEPNYGGSGGGAEDSPFTLTDYIQSSGTQWIDTGYYPKSSSKFQLVANVDSNNSDYVCPFGTREGTTGVASQKPALIFLKWQAENKLNAAWGSDDYQIYSTEKFFNIKCEYTLSAGYVALKTENLSNCIAYTFTGGTVTNSKSMYLFVLLNNTSPDTNYTLCKMKLYRFRIYEGNTLVHEFVPWTDEQNIVCLKDTVTGNLKYNAGSGSFVRGTDNN